MKYLLHAIVFLSILACQKKQFATFQKDKITTFHKRKKPTSIDLPTIKKQGFTIFCEIIKPTYPTKLTFTAERSSNRRGVGFIHKVKPATKNAISANRLKTEKQKKQFKPKSSNPDRLAKTALILGIASIVGVALLGSLGALIGILAIVIGAISYKKTTKRAWAIWGIILGSVSILAILIAFIALIILLTEIIGA